MASVNCDPCLSDSNRNGGPSGSNEPEQLLILHYLCLHGVRASVHGLGLAEAEVKG